MGVMPGRRKRELLPKGQSDSCKRREWRQLGRTAPGKYSNKTRALAGAAAPRVFPCDFGGFMKVRQRARAV